MLPMFVCGVLANLIAALIQHKISNKLLMGIGASSYLVAFVLSAVQRSGDSYWAFSFLGLCFVVVGADFQFVVTNVSILLFELAAGSMANVNGGGSLGCSSIRDEI